MLLLSDKCGKKRGESGKKRECSEREHVKGREMGEKERRKGEREEREERGRGNRLGERVIADV